VVGPDYGVPDISTIDATCDQAHAASFLSQVVEGFTDEQSTAALAEHRFSLYCLCRLYKTPATAAGSTRR
jgi:hypothetical protein